MVYLRDLMNYMYSHRGDSDIQLKEGYCMQIYQNAKRLNIKKQTENETILLCAIDLRYEQNGIYITFQKDDTPSEFGYKGEVFYQDEPISVLCNCVHPDGKKVYELLADLIPDKG